MLKKLLILAGLYLSAGLCAPETVRAQSAETRIASLMNAGDWFELERVLDGVPADSLSPYLYRQAKAMTHHYFNRPDSACIVLGELLNDYPAELGDQTLGTAVLMALNLARTDRYAEAAALLRSLCDQLAALGADLAQTEGLLVLAEQYRAFAPYAPVCRPMHPAGTYRIPMVVHDAMHRARKQQGAGHFIAMDGNINGTATELVFDTGAGVNVMSSAQAQAYGLRMLAADMPMRGVGTQTGRYAMADTLRIGEMVWANVPFMVVDIRTGDAEVDRIGTLLPPVLGLPLMFRMQEIRLDFEHREFIVPGDPAPNPLGTANLLRSDDENLFLATRDGVDGPLRLHFDTGGYSTTLLPSWYGRHQAEVQAAGIPDSLRIAGVGAVQATRSYLLPQREFRIGNGTAVLDSVTVDTGIDLRTGERRQAHYLDNGEDGTLGLDLLEHFRLVILNLKEMYLEALPF